MIRLFCFLALGGLLAINAAEIPLKHGKISVTLETRGGGLTRLEYDNEVFAVPGWLSFQERIVANTMETGDKKMHYESFDKLDFSPEIVSNSWKGSQVRLSARGVGSFDWLRLEKLYTFKQNSGDFKVDYILTNLDPQPRNAAIWCRTFLRNVTDPKSVSVSATGLEKGGTHPGNAANDEWVPQPKYNATAAYDPVTKSGALVELPMKYLSAFYNWHSTKENTSTTEVVTCEITLKPGESVTVPISVSLGKGIEGKISKVKARKPSAEDKTGADPFLVEENAKGARRKPFIQNNNGLTFKRSERSMSLVVPRQFASSIREVILPENAAPENVSMFQVANGKPDYSLEVPSCVKKTADGKNVFQFLVPGLNTAFGATKCKGDTFYRGDSYVGNGNFNVELVFDRAPVKKADPEIFAGGANLFENSDFSKVDENGIAIGWYSAREIWSRNWYTVKDGTLQLVRPSDKPIDKWTKFFESFVVEPNRKYTFSMRASCNNPTKENAVGGISFYDESRKEIKVGEKALNIRIYNCKRGSHGWQDFKMEFYAPENAKFATMSFLIYGIQQHILSFDDVKIVPEPYSPEVKSKRERLRDQLVNGWYAPLDSIESNSHDVVTPHKKWLQPAAFTLPKILFLPFVQAKYSTMERRTMVELAQRMDLSYEMIPLLAYVSFIPGNGVMGVYGAHTMPKLEPYTMECLKEAPHSPLIFINELNFKKHVQADFVQWLQERGKNASIVFLDCANVPAELLGTPNTTPPEFTLLPNVGNAKPRDFQKVFSSYQRGKFRTVCVSIKEKRSNPAVPQSQWDNIYTDYSPASFPYWEYQYLTLAKALRHAANIEPDAIMTGLQTTQNALNAEIQAKQDFSAQLRVEIMAMDRKPLGHIEEKIQIKPGKNTVEIALPPLPEGAAVADVQLLCNGKISDAAAVMVNIPKKIQIALEYPKGRNVPAGQPFPINVKVSNATENSDFVLEILDCDNRVVARKQSREPAFSYEFRDKFPFSTLYQAHVTVLENNVMRARQTEEIIVSGRAGETDEQISVVWPDTNTNKYALYKKYGIDQLVIWCRGNIGATRALRRMNLEPVVYGLGSTSFDNWRTYKDDKASDPVRIPCFNDAEATAKAKDNINNLVKEGQFDFYDVKYHFFGDEQFIGSTVCFSEHCLSAFREELKQSYGSIEKLNEAWGKSFKSFDEVKPVQLKEISDKTKLGEFLEHKLFINRVFANKYMGFMEQEAKKAAPASLSGISGTVNPGYSFDWALMMGKMNYLACYDGIQRKLARDFGRPEAIIGQWYGGYVAPKPCQGYVRSFYWRDLLQGGRLSANYMPNAGITGELKNTPQLDEYVRLLAEGKSGIAKLVYNSKEKPQIAMVYSQASLFAACGTIGMIEYNNSLDGWHALLGDIGVDYKFINAPDLPGKLDSSCKVLILPCALSLSDTELAAINSFAEKGGTVIEDFSTGVYDNHGVLRQGCKVPVVVNRKYEGVNVRSVDGETTFCNSVNKGKGRMFNANLLFSGYQQVVLGGTGGEISKNVSGAEELCLLLRKILEQELAKSGVKCERKVTGKDGKPRNAETVWRDFNGNYVLGIWKFDQTVPVVKPENGEMVTVQLPKSGHVYDVRNKRYLGKLDSVQHLLLAGDAGVYAVLKDKVNKVNLGVKKSAAPGESLNFTMDAGNGGHVFHCELLSPDGTVRYKRNIAAKDGKTSGDFQLAFNDVHGTWKLRVTDVATAVTATSDITVK